VEIKNPRNNHIGRFCGIEHGFLGTPNLIQNWMTNGFVELRNNAIPVANFFLDWDVVGWKPATKPY
jgi:hypothetical protein